MNPLASLGLSLGGSALSGLFGGKKSSTGSDWLGSAVTGLRGAGSQYQGLFNRGQDLSNLGYEGYADQLARVKQLLQTDPYTDQYRTGQINQATQGVGQAFQGAQANLTGDLAARGLSDSGLMAGGLASLEGARAGALAAPMVQVGQEATAQRQNNMLQLLQLLDQTQQQGNQLQLQGTQGQASAYGQIGALGQAQAQRDDADYQNYQNTVGSIGSGLGNLFGGSMFKRKVPGVPSVAGTPSSVPNTLGIQSNNINNAWRLPFDKSRFGF